jgi:hypothetical protein
MSIFDLLFIVLFLTSCVVLLLAAFAALRGRGRHALTILRNFAICFSIYMAIVFAVAMVTPRRIVNLSEPRCFDDWCIAVADASHQGSHYTVTFRLSSRARRVSQREKGINAYLIDAQGRRFHPAPDPSATPFDVLLDPGQSVAATRSYTLPPDARDVGVVLAHEGSYCFPGCFIIGDEANPLQRPTIVPLR